MRVQHNKSLRDGIIDAFIEEEWTNNKYLSSKRYYVVYKVQDAFSPLIYIKTSPMYKSIDNARDFLENLYLVDTVSENEEPLIISKSKIIKFGEEEQEENVKSNSKYPNGTMGNKGLCEDEQANQEEQEQDIKYIDIKHIDNTPITPTFEIIENNQYIDSPIISSHIEVEDTTNNSKYSKLLDNLL